MWELNWEGYWASWSFYLWYLLKVNDLITVKLKCTRGYYELLYFVNGESVGQPKVAYRLPNDKMYEMVIGLSDESVKIKCIQFMTKTYVPL